MTRIVSCSDQVRRLRLRHFSHFGDRIFGAMLVMLQTLNDIWHICQYFSVLHIVQLAGPTVCLIPKNRVRM